MFSLSALPFLLVFSPFTRASPTRNATLRLPAAPGHIRADADTCQDYKTCVSNGRRYWNILQVTIAQSHPVDRTGDKALFDTWYFTEAVGLGYDDVLIIPDLLKHGIDYEKMMRYESTSKDPDTGVLSVETAYQNAIDPVHGVIVADLNFNYYDDNRKLPWSEIIYQTWQRAKTTPEANLSTLQFSIQSAFDNEAAWIIIKLAHKSMGYPPTRGDRVWRKWTLADTPDWFYALLGTETCKGTIWLLNDHAAEAGKKVVTEIWTRWWATYPDIWMNIGPAQTTVSSLS